MQENGRFWTNRPQCGKSYRFFEAAKLERWVSALSLWGAIGTTGVRAASESGRSTTGGTLSSFTGILASTGFLAS